MASTHLGPAQLDALGVLGVDLARLHAEVAGHLHPRPEPGPLPRPQADARAEDAVRGAEHLRGLGAGEDGGLVHVVNADQLAALLLHAPAPSVS